MRSTPAEADVAGAAARAPVTASSVAIAPARRHDGITGRAAAPRRSTARRPQRAAPAFLRGCSRHGGDPASPAPILRDALLLGARQEVDRDQDEPERHPVLGARELELEEER